MFRPNEIVDLSNPIDEGMPIWPTFPEVDVTTTNWAAKDEFTMEHLSMNTHTGTHIDSPLHFLPEGKTLDDFPIEKFMGEGVAIDLQPKEPGEGITANELQRYEDEVRDDDVVMLCSGWDEYHGRTPEYEFEFPFLTGGAAEYLASLEPKAVGTDGASVGGWADEVPAHGLTTDVHPADSHLPLLENDIIPIEEVRNLEAVLDGRETRRAFFFFPPLNLRNTSGCSVRAFAFL